MTTMTTREIKNLSQKDQARLKSITMYLGSMQIGTNSMYLYDNKTKTFNLLTMFNMYFLKSLCIGFFDKDISLKTLWTFNITASLQKITRAAVSLTAQPLYSYNGDSG